MQIRRVLLEELLDTGCVFLKDTEVDGNTVTGVYTDEEYFGSEIELTQETLLELCANMAAEADVVYRFWFNPREMYVWYGGIYNWREPIPVPTNAEELEEFNKMGYPRLMIEGQWYSDGDADLVMMDQNFENLLIQLFTALFAIVHVND